ncbi:recombinase family protein [Vibrio sp. 10N.222.54.A3]|uniref:recombinase family protein n=1 Tax=Vibrio sp. 10N.222.54.A3 TaxID=3229633 RepID=UPI00354E2F92
MSSNPLRVIIPKIYNYARVSTSKQLKGVGLETQQQRSVLEDLSHKYSLPIHNEEFVDEGLSAYHGRHKEGALGVVLSRIETGEISAGSILAVFSLDRLSRETVNVAMEQLLSIINRGVCVYTHIDDKMFDAKSQNLTADLIVSLITMQRANEESSTKSKRIISASKEALKKWKKDGKPQGALGRAPFWIDQTTNSFNINAEGVKVAIELFLDGWGTLKIKKYLDEHHIYKRTRKSSVKQDETWDYVAINQLWTKRSLIGEKRFTIEGHEHILPNYYPPLIEVDAFQRLQKVKQSKSGRAPVNGNIHLLKGMARCGKCGAAMVFIDKGNSNRAYVCSLAAKGERQHDRELYSSTLLELITLEICKDIYLLDSSSSSDIAIEKAEVESRLIEEKIQLDELVSRYKKKKRNSLLDLIQDSEDEIEKLELSLQTFEVEDLSTYLNLLKHDIYTDEVRDDYQHPQRVEIRNNLLSVLKEVKLNRVENNSSSSKTGVVNCVDITWYFKNGQERKLQFEPFKYIGSKKDRKIFVGVNYSHDVPVQEVNRSSGLIPNLIDKLHKLDLLNKAYPSKGRYQWKGLELVQGEYTLSVKNVLPRFGDYSGLSFGDMVDKHFEKGVKYTVIESNSLGH